MGEGCFADRLYEAIRAKGSPTVVNLDPVFTRLPDAFTHGEPVAGILAFSKRLIQVVAPLVPVLKINSAYFEQYYAEGVRAYYELVREASAQGLIVIGDAKRGDVGHTAEMYAGAHLARPAATRTNGHELVSPDAVTINGYFGWDGVKPFAEVARVEGRGVFVLVRTSNPSAAAIQDVVTKDGRRVCEIVAAEVTKWAEQSGTNGNSGYSGIGAVVATRDPADAARLRAAMPRSVFLVPGYGAQGGKAEDFVPYFKPDGTGALIAAGRSVIFAHQVEQYAGAFGEDWEKCVQASCEAFVTDIKRIVPHT